MTRPRSAGLIAYNGQIIDGVQLPGEPILDADTYAAILALFAGHGLVASLPAGTCSPACSTARSRGAVLAGRPVTGTTRRQYWCKVKHPARPFVGTARIEEWGAVWATEVLTADTKAEELEAEERELAARSSALALEIASADELANAVGARLGRGEITIDRYEAITRPLEDRLVGLRKEMDALTTEASELAPIRRGRIKMTPEKQATYTWMEVFEDGTVTEQRAAIRRALAGRHFIVGPGTAARFDPERVSVTH